jgi:hypothetical protein
MFSDGSGQVVGCHGTDNQLELFYFCTDDEAQVRLKKRLRKERKKKYYIYHYCRYAFLKYFSDQTINK